VADVAADEFVALACGDLDDAVERVLGRLGVDDPRVCAAAVALAHELDSLPPAATAAADKRS
jgi:hypothetical protein